MSDDTGEDRLEETDETAEEHFDTDKTWDELGVSAPLQKALEEMGYSHPTQVQAASLPKAFAGRDLLVRSKTGTGKTTAFALPILERVADGERRVKALVLAPTRELAIQVADETRRLAAHRDIGVVAVYGGVAIGPQTDALKAGAEVVVGTPGRVLDHLRRRNLVLDQCSMVCLDEADEMLSMGFLEDVGSILDHVPPKPQMLLFSATVEADLRNLIARYAAEPEDLFLSTDTRTVEGLEHILYETTSEYPKPRQLMTILDIEAPGSGIIFCQTRDEVAMLGAYLSRQGIDAEFISSDLSQKARERVMGRIKRGEIRFLVATDIASRGIDISNLSHVINYSLPEDPASYLHRVGRTARIGKTGTAISLMSGRELGCRKILENTWGIDFNIKKLPALEDARKLWLERHVAELEDAMERVAFDAYLDMARQLKQRKDGDVLLATALRGFFIWSRMQSVNTEAEQQLEDRRQRPPRQRQGPRKGGHDRGGPPRSGGNKGHFRGKRRRRSGGGDGGS